MIVTDLDGNPIELSVNMIKFMYDRKAYREVRTFMKDVLQVKESVPEIMKKIMEDKKNV